jgi:MerR family redox-sensitive transcriptional activator SoxR
LKSNPLCPYARQRAGIAVVPDDLELSACSGAAPSALRYYEEIGLIAAERTGGNQRRYARHTLRRVAFVRAGRRLGLSLGEIKQALDRLPAGKAPTRAEWSRAARMWQARIRAKISELERLSDTLGGCTAAAPVVARAPYNADDERARAARARAGWSRTAAARSGRLRRQATATATELLLPLRHQGPSMALG